MTINEKLREKGLSRYSLSQKSGVPWATLSDICSGKTSLARCSAKTIQKLAAALDMTIEEILRFDAEPEAYADSSKKKEGRSREGKPNDRSYLELNLSEHLQKAVNDYTEVHSVKNIW